MVGDCPMLVIMRVFCPTVLQRRGSRAVRPRAQVRARLEAGRPPHPPTRRVQWPQLRQQGKKCWLGLKYFSP